MANPDVAAAAADDARFMARAIGLAWRGLGSTYPNPAVGAVVVHNGAVVGRGRTATAGGPHAEARALARAGAQARGGTLYVTLEPCAHHGRTPPCTDAIVEAGIRRVVVGVSDPGAHVRGRGLRALRKAGIVVEEGVAESRCRDVHEHYLHHCQTGRPFVVLKAALSLDGRMAARGGDSRWITGEPARRDAHRLRARCHAIGVGAETVRTDDPQLTVRHVRGTDPTAVVFDGRLGLGTASRRVWRPGTLVLAGARSPAATRRRLEARGVEILAVPLRRGRVDLDAALAALGQRSVCSLVVEGGGKLHASFVAAGLWDEMVVYSSYRLLGEGRPFLPGLRWKTMDDVSPVRLVSRGSVGDDVRTILRPGRT